MNSKKGKRLISVIGALVLLISGLIIGFSACDGNGDDEILFLAVGGRFNEPGVLCSSYDGLGWNLGEKILRRIWSITYGDGWFVGVGHAGFVFRSQDGIAYTVSPLLNFGYDHMNDVAAGEKTNESPWKQYYVAVGNDGLVVYSSDHGLNWIYGNSGTTVDLVGVAYGLTDSGSCRFVAVGGVSDTDENAVIKYSMDGGQTWMNPSFGGVSEALRKVAFGNGRFVAVGVNGTIIYSPNGAAWYPAASVATSNNLSGVAYGNGVWVAISFGGEPICSLNNGSTWISSGIEFIGPFGDVAFGDGKFVVAGDQEIIYSTDGMNWITAAAFGDPEFWFWDVAFRKDTR